MTALKWEALWSPVASHVSVNLYFFNYNVNEHEHKQL